MKKNTFLLVMIGMVLAFGTAAIGCDNDTTPPKSTYYTYNVYNGSDYTAILGLGGKEFVISSGSNAWPQLDEEVSELDYLIRLGDSSMWGLNYEIDWNGDRIGTIRISNKY